MKAAGHVGRGITIIHCLWCAASVLGCQSPTSPLDAGSAVVPTRADAGMPQGAPVLGSSQLGVVAVSNGAGGALLGKMIDAVQAEGATPILVTPSALQEWSGEREGNMRLGPYADAMKTIAPMKHVLVDDLNARGVELLNMIGKTAAMQIYINGDKAHFTKDGATRMAVLVAQELRRIGSPLAAYLKDVP